MVCQDKLNYQAVKKISIFVTFLLYYRIFRSVSPSFKRLRPDLSGAGIQNGKSRKLVKKG